MIACFPLLVALLAAAPAAPTPAASELRLLPAPRSVTPGSGRLALRGEVRIAVAPGNADDAFAAALLAEEIESGSAAKARVVEGDAGDIVLARDGSLADAGEEGYRIEVKPGGARLTARTGAGLYYAVQTLRQMVREDGIPAAIIADRPAMRWR